MKLRYAAALALVIALTAVIGPTCRAHAHDAEEEHGGHGGCLCGGSADDNSEGEGSVGFIYEDDKPSYFFFDWNGENFAFGPAEGSISRKEIEFNGNAGHDCTVTGSGKGDDLDFSGKFKFHGKCAKFFKSGTFSFSSPSFCACTYDPKKKEWQAND